MVIDHGSRQAAILPPYSETTFALPSMSLISTRSVDSTGTP
jgi:hypothetical protein